MNKTITKDGTPTYWNEKFGEYYHSVTGAKEEAIKKFIEPCHLDKKKGKIVLLDVCFGWGYNTAAALDIIGEHPVKVIGLEIDESVLQQIPNNNAPFNSYNFIKNGINNRYKLSNTFWELSIIIGDATETIKKISSDYVDYIFYDPFSPKKCPELWTLEFMKELYRVMKQNGILTTYSCARIVRNNLHSCGFKIENGPCVGRRGPSTIAVK